MAAKAAKAAAKALLVFNCFNHLVLFLNYKWHCRLPYQAQTCLFHQTPALLCILLKHHTFFCYSSHSLHHFATPLRPPHTSHALFWYHSYVMTHPSFKPIQSTIHSQSKFTKVIMLHALTTMLCAGGRVTPPPVSSFAPRSADPSPNQALPAGQLLVMRDQG